MALFHGKASADIDAPLDSVWAIVQDVEHAPDWQKGMDSMHALDRDAEGRAIRAQTATDAGIVTVKTTVRFTYTAPTRLAWKQEKGELKALDGAWELSDLGDGRTRATYLLDIDPGMGLGLLLRGSVEARMREILVSGRPGELKARAEQE